MAVDTPLPEEGDEWADIPGFTGFQASADGRIRNRRGRIVRQRRGKNNSRRVHLGKATRMVHNLILRAFTGHPTFEGDHLCVKHLNGDLSDNTLDNLVWADKPRTIW